MLNGNINVYVDEEGKLHFVNGNGADTVLPFNNKSLKISSWYYQINGGETVLIFDFINYNTLSIGEQDGGGTLAVYGKNESETEISIESDGYYNISAYNQVVIRLTNNIYTNGTLNNIELK